MTAREHAKFLGLLFWIYVALNVVIMVGTGIFMLAWSGVIMSEMAKMPHQNGQPGPEMMLGMMGGIMLFAFILGFALLIPQFFAGYGLRKGKSYARVLTIIASVLAVFSFPFGTALGVYGLWFVFGERGKIFFGGDNSAPPTAPPGGWQ